MNIQDKPNPKQQQDFTADIIESISSLDRWIEKNGWAGYDPYDIMGHHWVIRLTHNQRQNRVVRTIIWGLLFILNRFPLTSRKLLRIEKQINAMSMGLLASAYINLYQHSKDRIYFQKAIECLKWLEQNKVENKTGTCWSNPFHWQSAILIEKGTPTSTTTVICGEAFWDSYKVTGNTKYLNICESICQFIITDLNIDYINDHRICFSYTPIDRFHVHNSNLLLAQFLIKVGKELHRQDLYQHGIKALDYTLAAQNEDGSFYYWGSGDGVVYHISEASLKNIDHYHTSFILKSLQSAYYNINENRIFAALSLGYQFYKHNLFEDKTMPKLKPDSKYPINIASCAEAILCMSALGDLFPDAHEYAQNVFIWTRDNMQDKDGHFYYAMTENRIIKIPYMRWGQAWMLYALANLLTIQQKRT